MKKHILLLTAVLYPCVMMAQETASNTKTESHSCFRASDLAVSTGFFSQATTNSTVEDFRKLAPNSTLLNFNSNGYSRSFGTSFDSYTVYNTAIGIQLLNKRKQEYRNNPQLRIGISYTSESLLSAYYNRETSRPYDTLSSSQTGQAIYVDSVFNSSYSMNYYNNVLSLDLALLFRTNPEARWALFAGIGCTAGISLNAYTSIFHLESSGTISYSDNASFNNYYGNSFRNTDVEYESFNNKGGYSITGYLPIGVDWRIGKKREFWMPLHLFYEMRPGLNISNIPELGSQVTANLQNSWGVRYRFAYAAAK